MIWYNEWNGSQGEERSPLNTNNKVIPLNIYKRKNIIRFLSLSLLCFDDESKLLQVIIKQIVIFLV